MKIVSSEDKKVVMFFWSTIEIVGATARWRNGMILKILDIWIFAIKDLDNLLGSLSCAFVSHDALAAFQESYSWK